MLLPFLLAGASLFAIGTVAKIIPLGEYISDLVKMLYDYCNIFQGIGIMLIASFCFILVTSVIIDRD